MEAGWNARNSIPRGDISVFQLTLEGNVGVSQKNKGARAFKFKEQYVLRELVAEPVAQ